MKKTSEQKNTITPPYKKGKSLSGRKPGYKMKEWQKEVQLASLRNRDLENFNVFLNELVSLFRAIRGERFFLAPFQIDKDLFFPEDHIYVLEKVLLRPGVSGSDALFFYRHVHDTCRRTCLKTYEQYDLTKDLKLFPLEERVRKDLYNTIRTVAFSKGLRFPEQDLICRNLDSFEQSPYAELAFSIPGN